MSLLTKGALDRSLNFVDFEWFCNVVEGTRAHRLNGGFNCVLATNHHHHGFGSFLNNVWHQIQATDTAHVYVADYQLKLHDLEQVYIYRSSAHRDAVVID